MTTLALPAAAVKPTRRAALDRPDSPEVDDFTWELGPDAADDRWHAEQSTDHHFDGPEPDWDGMADESAALDRLCAGGLL